MSETPHVPRYDTADAVDDAIAGAKARYDHGESAYDPDVLTLIRAAETMRAQLHDTNDGALAQLDESEQLRERMSRLLTGVAAGLKGDPLPLMMHDWSDLPALSAAMRAKLYGPVAADPMPVFVIKAKDKLAPDAIGGYVALCEAVGLVDQTRQARHALSEVKSWQDRNAGHVKMPYHQHVPVGLQTATVTTHAWQEYNDYGNTCHWTRCSLTEEQHPQSWPPQ